MNKYMLKQSINFQMNLFFNGKKTKKTKQN